MDEAPEHPHNKERKSFAQNAKGKMDPVREAKPISIISIIPNPSFKIPAPRLSNHQDKSAEIVGRSEPKVGEHSVQVLEESGFNTDQIEKFKNSGIIECAGAKSRL